MLLEPLQEEGRGPSQVLFGPGKGECVCVCVSVCVCVCDILMDRG